MDLSPYMERNEGIAFRDAVARAMQPTVELPVIAESATLIVGAFTSRCSACGGNADPTERAHISGGRRGAYETGSALADRNGCRAVFVAVDDPRGVFTLDGGDA